MPNEAEPKGGCKVRFYKTGHARRRGLILSIAAFLLVLALAVVLLGKAEQRVDEERYEILENALRRAAVTCYALEGRYPPTLEYLIDHYDVIVDTERFFVRYDIFAQNIMPDIAVFPENEGESGDV